MDFIWISSGIFYELISQHYSKIRPAIPHVFNICNPVDSNAAIRTITAPDMSKGGVYLPCKHRFSSAISVLFIHWNENCVLSNVTLWNRYVLFSRNTCIYLYFASHLNWFFSQYLQIKLQLKVTHSLFTIVTQPSHGGNYCSYRSPVCSNPIHDQLNR